MDPAPAIIMGSLHDAMLSFDTTIHAFPFKDERVLDVIRSLQSMIESIPGILGVDNERVYEISIGMDEMASKLYLSSIVACMGEKNREIMRGVKDAVSRVKNECFKEIGLLPDPS
jgi:hypothetical protein